MVHCSFRLAETVHVVGIVGATPITHNRAAEGTPSTRRPRPVRLAGGAWHNVLSFRILERGEITGGIGPAPPTGA
jgi:hypothetical protein